MKVLLEHNSYSSLDVVDKDRNVAIGRIYPMVDKSNIMLVLDTVFGKSYINVDLQMCVDSQPHFQETITWLLNRQGLTTEFLK